MIVTISTRAPDRNKQLKKCQKKSNETSLINFDLLAILDYLSQAGIAVGTLPTAPLQALKQQERASFYYLPP